MKKRVLALSAAILITLGSGAAYAGDTVLFTPMLSSPTGGSLWCNVTNVGKKPLSEIYIRVISDPTQAFNTCTDVPPQSSMAATATCKTYIDGSASAVCVITITGGSHKSVRAVLNVVDSSGATILSVPATK